MDYKKKPDFTFDMNVGDILFVPGGWWHSVVTVDGAVLVGSAFESRKHGLQGFSKCLSGINKHGHDKLADVVAERKKVCETHAVPVPKRVAKETLSKANKTFAAAIRKQLVKTKVDKNTRRTRNGRVIRRGKKQHFSSRKKYKV